MFSDYWSVSTVHLAHLSSLSSCLSEQTAVFSCPTLAVSQSFPLQGSPHLSGAGALGSAFPTPLIIKWNQYTLWLDQNDPAPPLTSYRYDEGEAMDSEWNQSVCRAPDLVFFFPLSNPDSLQLHISRCLWVIKVKKKKQIQKFCKSKAHI